MSALILSFFLIAATENQTSLFIEKIEAKVGSQIITSTDISLKISELSHQTREKKNKTTLRSEALNQLIDKALIKEYLESLRMGISEQDVNRRIDMIRASQGADTIDEFRQMLASQGMSLKNFKYQVKNQMELSQFLQILQRQTLQTTDQKELKAYYNDHISEFQKNIELNLQECLIPYGNNKKKALQIAAIYQKHPKRFAQCVRNYSKSPSAKVGGRLGNIHRDNLRDDIAQKVFSTRLNHVATIENPGAIQLLKVLKKKDLGPRSFSDVQDEIQQKIESERLTKARDKLLSDLRAKTFIKIES